MKIKGVDFPEPLLNALRDEKLVMFAGAGVSMGPPAGLPSFCKLAERVTEGTSQSIAGSETEDQSWGGHKAARVRRATISCHAPIIQRLLQCTEACFSFSPPLIQAGSSPPVSTACLSGKRGRSKMNQSVHAPYAPPRRPQRCKQYHRQA